MRLFVAATLLACGAQSTPATVTVAAPPNASGVTPVHVASVSQAFLDAGCFESAMGLDCSKSRLEDVKACLWPLRHVDATFHPPAYVMECHVRDGDGLHETGCKLTSNVVLYAATRSRIVRIATKKDLAATFAPVTTPEEAIAFARVLTGDEAFDRAQTADDGTPMLTRAVLENDAFRLRLFRYQSCGCEHPIRAIDYRVQRDGAVTELASAIAQRNTHDDGMCKD